MSRLKPAPATKRLGAEYALISKQDHGAPSTGVSLKDRAAQERLFRDVLEQLQPHIAAVESGQWMQAQEARTDKLEPIVAACRKLREGVYALAQLDEFSVDVYEAAAQACMAAQRNDELHKTLVVLVREIYPAVAIGLDPARARRRRDFIGCLALRLLCQDANSGEFNSLLQQLSRADIESPPLQFVLAVHGAVSLRRFRAFFKLCRSASPWHALVLETFKSNVRQTAISILTASFPSLPLSVLAHWLELTDDNCRQFLEQTCRFTADQLGDGLTVTFRSAHSTRVPAPVK
ncbi:hypothetical protein CAOG_02926 [Capsaspora owczarzaki ATCC 30864]|uniref:SAC3/GANP/THP3 conserved domain-containing protein n=1 Tax=Capsaspora owczarzaki (strain ATCC 30864) TaxID=595528 RepID=A0A0D2VNG4_CAPO3|nr:hypothetical protein CAOG_02926 [Capsaspora owczarzaki ATCC 30864]KJE91857.1 hypothetical protein CAOG_002926 [Capsaspora owczarzaki ATCC 30864]|eukprot:XP_004363765.1 hypothetical protein CAOG_02926 [Capsaspora owczarzaki ATCC 30864]